MCTVTFIPASGSVFLTSNRDENKLRSRAITPAQYDFGGSRMIYPADPDAGGTWIAAHENGNAIVFLNGARIRHEKNPPYKKSRGLILLDLLRGGDPLHKFECIDLQNIEPFTAVILQGMALYQCRWDGSFKESEQLDASLPHIWSSCTLYTEDIIEKRKGWFDQWMIEHPVPTRQEIEHFHLFTGDGDQHNDLRMNRNDRELTVSVTSMQISAADIFMQHHDLQSNDVSNCRLRLMKTFVEQ